MNLDYDKVMSFLANSTLKELSQWSKNLDFLKKKMADAYVRDWGNLEPDTQEALEAATADGSLYDRAEEKIYYLLKHQPETWKAIKLAVKQLDPDSGIAAFLDGY
jgi:predicted aldo/keto reductase-like oxidoreductase